MVGAFGIGGLDRDAGVDAVGARRRETLRHQRLAQLEQLGMLSRSR